MRSREQAHRIAREAKVESAALRTPIAARPLVRACLAVVAA
jgi:hypothetical protein